MRIIIFLILIISGAARAQSHSMRSCLLLPISDDVGGAIATKLYQIVEDDLKNQNWCEYKSGSGLLGIFQKYRENLPLHLKNQEVLKTVANKVEAGSLIRIVLKNELNGIEIQLDVIGSNGEDILFSEKTILAQKDLEIIFAQIKTWLDYFSKSIPYEGLVVGVVGDQVMVKVIGASTVKPGQGFVIKKLKSIKRHPLLKKIVEWDTITMSKGKVIAVSGDQFTGQISVYYEGKKVEKNWWAILEPQIDDKTLDQIRDRPLNPEAQGKLGLASAYLTFSSASISSSPAGESRAMSGLLVGLDLRAEAWVTRNYFASLALAKNLGSFNKSQGNTDAKKIDASYSHGKFYGGYKYLPLGFFYGPQIDVYAGYANYNFGVSTSKVDGFGESTFSGILLGVASNFPLSREYRVFVRSDFIPFPSVSDESGVFGSLKTKSLLQLEGGVKYQYNSLLTMDLMLEMTSAKATMSGDVSSVSYKDTRVKLGTSFNF